MSKTYQVAVIGAGTMGAGIAQKMALEGLKVYLVDMKEEFVQAGMDKIKDSLKDGVKKGVYPQEIADNTLANLQTTTDYHDIAHVDFVVEAVFEDLDVKRDVFRQLDEICDDKTILSSNTSSFYIKDIAEATKRPDRVIGYHYFFPPVKNRLLEVIAHDGTSEETLEIAREIGAMHGKTVIDVADSPGFAVNRYFVPWLNEATRLLEDGVANIPTIDRIAEEAFKVGMGPFKLMNASGIPIAFHSSETLAREVSEFYTPTKTLADQTASGEFWDTETGDIDESKFEEVQRHLLATSLGVAARLIDENVATVEDVERGAKVGLKWKFGPFELINLYGPENVYKWTEELSEKRAGFALSDNLKAHAESKTPYDFQFINLDTVGKVSYITINRPEAMNALNPVVAEQLLAAYNEAEKDTTTEAIAIRGTGKAFVAGADIKFFLDSIKNDDFQRNYDFTKASQDLWRRMETSDKKTIAIVDGLSLGGGSELAFAQNEIVATEKASFGFPESGLGIYPGMGGMTRLIHFAGKELAKYFVLTGKIIDVETAKELGIISEVVNVLDIEKTVAALAEEPKRDKYAEHALPEKYAEIVTAFSDENINALLKGESIDGVSEDFVERTHKTLSHKSPNAIKEINAIMDKEAEISIDDAIDLEMDALEDIFASDETLHGLEANVAGKRPDFSQFK